MSRFPQKLWNITNQCKTGAIGWSSSPSNDTIFINYESFQQEYLTGEGAFFKTTNIASFIRQLNLYGFKKLFSDHGTERRQGIQFFKNPFFVRGRSDLLREVQRTYSLSTRTPRQNLPASTSSTAALSVPADFLARTDFMESLVNSTSLNHEDWPTVPNKKRSHKSKDIGCSQHLLSSSATIPIYRLSPKCSDRVANCRQFFDDVLNKETMKFRLVNKFEPSTKHEEPEEERSIGLSGDERMPSNGRKAEAQSVESFLPIRQIGQSNCDSTLSSGSLINKIKEEDPQWIEKALKSMDRLRQVPLGSDPVPGANCLSRFPRKESSSRDGTRMSDILNSQLPPSLVSLSDEFLSEFDFMKSDLVMDISGLWF